jgi:hypothetical protein
MVCLPSDLLSDNMFNENVIVCMNDYAFVNLYEQTLGHALCASQGCLYPDVAVSDIEVIYAVLLSKCPNNYSILAFWALPTTFLSI